MGAWNALFSDKNIVTGTETIKGRDGVTRSVKPVTGPAGLSDEDFAAAVGAGSATLTETRKVVTAKGEPAVRKRIILPGDISGFKAEAAYRDITGMAPAVLPTATDLPAPTAENPPADATPTDPPAPSKRTRAGAKS